MDEGKKEGSAIQNSIPIFEEVVELLPHQTPQLGGTTAGIELCGAGRSTS